MMNRIARLLVATVASFILISATSAPEASAARGWCRFDPVIMVDGQLADVFVGSTLEMLSSATGPVKIEIIIPTGSKGYVVLTDLGFLKGYSIVFKQSSSLVRTAKHTQIRIRVYAPAKNSALPVTVTFAPRSLTSSLWQILIGTSVDGHANQWISLTTR
jgi:hypothetical protein